MSNTNPSQEAQIMQHLREHGSISQREAYELYGIMRLSGRIYNLVHKEGQKIISQLEYGKNRGGAEVRYARYYLEEA